MGPRTWRDWFGLRCRAIAWTDIDTENHAIHVKLCERWKFHRGECR